jgi:hypothetical protein
MAPYSAAEAAVANEEKTPKPTRPATINIE